MTQNMNEPAAAQVPSQKGTDETGGAANPAPAAAQIKTWVSRVLNHDISAYDAMREEITELRSELKATDDALEIMTGFRERADEDNKRFMARIHAADHCILLLTSGSDRAAGWEAAKNYMADYGDSPDNDAIDKAAKERK